MTRTALVTGGSRGTGAALSRKLQEDGVKVAVTYAGNDKAAAAFGRETGIEIYKWNVANYDESVAGIATEMVMAVPQRPGASTLK